MSTAPLLLDEWRAPNRGVRIRIEWLTELRDVSEQYVSPPRSVRLLWTYVQRVGFKEAMAKVRSRLSETGRNRKIAAFGFGYVQDGPSGPGLDQGTPVAFFAPSVAPHADRVVIDRAFVRSTARLSLPADGLKLPDQLLPYVAWSPFSEAPLTEEQIDRGLRELSDKCVPVHDGAPVMPLAVVARDQHEPARSHARKPDVVIFGLGNYAKQLIVPNIPPHLHLARVHELDPRQLSGWGRTDVALDTSPWPRDDEQYDLWFVAGYHATHASIALTALARGGAVAVEKPLATSKRDLQAIRHALQGSEKARLFTCFQRRYAEYNAWVREDLGAQPGDPLDYNCIVYEIPLSPLHWYCWPSSRSRLVSNGCHWIDHFMFLNDYAEVTRLEVIPGSHNGSVAFISLANGAEFTMRLTEIGSPRIGVRDHVEISLGSRTATIRNASSYLAEDATRTLRRRRVSVMAAYRQMYQEICRRTLAGEPGDSIASLGSSFASIDLDDLYRARVGG